MVEFLVVNFVLMVFWFAAGFIFFRGRELSAVEFLIVVLTIVLGQGVGLLITNAHITIVFFAAVASSVLGVYLGSLVPRKE